MRHRAIINYTSPYTGKPVYADTPARPYSYRDVQAARRRLERFDFLCACAYVATGFVCGAGFIVTLIYICAMRSGAY